MSHSTQRETRVVAAWSVAENFTVLVANSSKGLTCSIVDGRIHSLVVGDAVMHTEVCLPTMLAVPHEEMSRGIPKCREIRVPTLDGLIDCLDVRTFSRIKALA